MIPQVFRISISQHIIVMKSNIFIIEDSSRRVGADAGAKLTALCSNNGRYGCQGCIVGWGRSKSLKRLSRIPGGVGLNPRML
jgi:hypothetical protein